MPPKKGKKGKGKDDDGSWAGKEISIPGLEALQDEFEPQKKASSSFANLANLNDDEPDPFAGEDMGGGLMGAIQANINKKGKKKDKKNAPSRSLVDDDPDESSPTPPATEPAVEKTAEELAEEEWALPEKKGKGKKGQSVAKASPVPPPEQNVNDPGDDAGEDEQPGRILSKKEKEKLKKERDKAKKKAQAQNKKAEAAADDEILAAAVAASASGPAPTTTVPQTSAQPAPTGDDEGDDDEEGDAGAKSDKKKKKKKKAAAPAPAPAQEAPKKVPKHIAALRQAQEEQKRLAEEAARKAEEERLRIEEEERRAAEEERLKEEAKQRKKDKEKAKKELAKKEGRYLTDKQKKEKAQAELQRQALIASGVRIEGLQRSAEGESAKRVVYGNRKKKPAQKGAGSIASPSEPSTPDVRSSQPSLPDESELSPSSPVASTIEAPSPAADIPDDVKDEWDASTDEDEEASPAPTPAPVSNKTNGAKSVPSVPSPAARPDAAASAKPGPSKAVPSKAAPTAESSEEDSDEDSEDEDDSEEDSEEDSEDDSDESDEELTAVQKQAQQRKAEAAQRRAQRHEEALAARSKDNLRSPICCILGHVDTGKTKLLDKIRQTNVQEGEAGGITQQIGATYFPVSAIQEKTAVMNRDGSQEYNIPGLLVIDTPGHESFTNLRSRGSSLCNIAVLVVDIMHGLEPQTLESLRLLRDKKTPFIVALNKIDRIYGWVATPDGAFRETLAKQNDHVKREFETRVASTITAFAEQGLNSVLYYDNKNMARNVSLVPTSAVTGEGVPDLIMLLVQLTQTRLSNDLMYLSELECTILEVKIIEGLGTTIDVVLSNGVLREGDKIVLCGLNGPIVTQVRALLTPQPMRELRIKSAYVHHKEVKAALGVKITAPDLEKAIAGSRLMVCGPDDDEDDLKEEVMSDLTNLLSSVDRTGRGVSVQASTLGSLEALLEFLKVSKIPVASIGLGPVHKRDIMQAAIMVEKAKELACVLCFDVPVDKDAEKIAEEYGIKIFKADIIYHLFDAFTAYNAQIVEAKRKDAAPQAIWPCRLKIIAVFTKRDPIILGVDIIDGTLRVGTPLCVVKNDPATGKRDIIPLGKITSLEINHKSMDLVKKSQAGGGVAVKIEHAVYQSAKMYGRHFDDKDELLSHITRASIDVLKETFRNDLTKEDAILIKGLKTRLGID